MGTTLPGCGTVKSPFRNLFTIKAEDCEEWNRERERTHRERDQLLGRKLHREYLLGDTDQVNRIEEGKITNNGSFTK